MLKYLDKLKPAMSVDDSKEVSLLIGANCFHDLDTSEVIAVKMGPPMRLRHY